MTHPATTKAALRARMRAARAAMTAPVYVRASEAIVRRLAALPAIVEAECLHAYWPLLDRREVDIRPLLEGLHRGGKQIVLPVVIPDTAGGAPRMEHRVYEGPGRLKKNVWGLDEPAGTRTVPPSAIDVVIVPALAVDAHGTRLGYGKGYYDVFLAERSVPTVCPLFDACLVETLPREPHDVPVSVVVTETRIVQTKPAGA